MKKASNILVMLALVLLMSVTAAQATQVVFQVNMTIQEQLGNFDPETDTVVVRGGFNNWDDDSLMLTQLNDSVWTGTFEIAPGDYEYKFRIVRDDTWESIGNRTVTVQASGLQVLPVVYFNDVPVLEYVDIEVLFRVDLRVQTLREFFDPETDWIVVRGAHPAVGEWGGAVARLTEETTNPGIWSAWIEFDSILVGQAQPYKFVILHDGDVNDGTGWEQTPDRTFSPTGDEVDQLPPPSGNGYAEIMPEVVFWSDLDFDDIIGDDLYVTFQVDLRPLHGRVRDTGILGIDAQTQDTIFPPLVSINLAGFFNAFPWGSFDPEYNLNDDGADGDRVADDTVWTVTRLFPAGTERALVYKYGVNELDAEAGFALNHVANLVEGADTFVVDVVCFGDQGEYYNQWMTECQASDVPLPRDGEVPSAYILGQNYPNPFNPTTLITFAIPRQDVLTLRVYDVLGREVVTRELGRMEAGVHNLAFDGSKLSTGVYFYRLESPSFNATRKMLLLK